MSIERCDFAMIFFAIFPKVYRDFADFYSDFPAALLIKQRQAISLLSKVTR